MRRQFLFWEVRVNEIIFIVSEPPEGGYAAEALGQSIFTVADTWEELNEMVRDAECHVSRSRFTSGNDTSDR